MESLTGFIEHIVYRNEENGYTVFELVNDNEEMTCVGSFQYINEGEQIEVQGTYKEHPLYGQQLQVVSFETKEPEDAASIERYLSSGAVKGIGPALASKIIKKFGDQTFRIIEEEPERLAEIKGISEKKAREISSQVEEKKDMRQAMLFLQKYGITNQLAVKIYKNYKERLYQIVEENPYQMADDIKGVGFRIADQIARRVGIHTDSDFRIRSGILYTLMQAAPMGHVYLPQEELLRRTEELLGVEVGDLEKFLMDMCMEHKVVIKEIEDEKMVYASTYYYLELNVAKMLLDLNVKYEEMDIVIKNRLSQIEQNFELSLDEMQRRAVIESAKNGLLVVTGGPGTGKTTTINAIIRYFESEGLEIFLAAPTGRAAKRMTEATGYEAQTIHRLLEVSGGPEEDTIQSGFGRNEENPLEADVIIIDEMSMVDIHLMSALLKAVVVGTRLILVGDVNQLPSVGPGSVLKDIINSHHFNVVKLTKIFRQASKSDIIVNAHKINAGEQVILDNQSEDFFFLKRQDANVIISVLITLIQKKMPKYVDASPFDIQVLTPTRKGLIGVERLNKILQEYLNPPAPGKREKQEGDILFREGDKVMQIKNNYQLEWEVRSRYGIPVEKGVGVFNGDMGVIKTMNTFSETMEVEYDEGRSVTYTYKQLDELELAYAITIHKSQGSEYPAVVIPLLAGPRMLMNRNLLYTAVTRAKKCVTLVGSEETFREMIQNESEQKRYTSLTRRIIELED